MTNAESQASVPLSAYRSDLAYIHDSGFGQYALSAAKLLLERLPAPPGLVVELGCGSGIMAAEVTAAGYDVLGYDISPAMVELTRERAPQGEFHVASFLDAELPPCMAVAVIGEVFNYQFDPRNSASALRDMLRRIAQALLPGGVLLFDGATRGRIPEGHRRSFMEGPDWACLVDATESPDGMLTRQITSFRQQGELYHRDQETHVLRLFDEATMVGELTALGFEVQVVRRYGELEFPPGYVGFVARKL